MIFCINYFVFKYFHCSRFLCLIWHSNIKMGYHPDLLKSYQSAQRKSRVFTTILCIAKLTLKGPITTKVVCFSRLLKCLRSLYGKQCGPRSDCSYRSSLFWVHPVCLYTVLNLSVMLGNFLQQTTSADDIFRCFFFLAL